MPNNFFRDNADLQFRFERLDLGEALEMLEEGYRLHRDCPWAPRNLNDALDTYGHMLTVLGDLCANQIAPLAAAVDEEGPVCRDGCVEVAAGTREAMRLLRQADLVGVTLPYRFGGMNLPATILQMIVEIISRADASLMTVYGLQEIAALMIADYGDEEMKARILPRVVSGELKGGAMVLTEAEAGSDLGAVKTRATQDPQTGVWRLNGVKRFITMGCGDVLLVLARSEEGSTDARGLSLFEVIADETVRVRRIENKLGLHGSPTCELQFRDTPARLLGQRRMGLIRYAMAMMSHARLAVASQALGIAEAACREALAYAQKRVQFGRPIEEIPAVARMLLEMASEIEATRALLYATAHWVDLARAYNRAKERGDLTPEGRARLRLAERLSDALTPLVKYCASEMANRVANQALQVHGGVGYMREFNVERHYRDARITNIYEGTSQLQVVAAVGPLLSRTLEPLLQEWEESLTLPELGDLRAQAEAATGLLRECVERLHAEEDRGLIDYYAADLADVAVGVLRAWLVLRDALHSPRKAALARVFIGAALPRIRRHAELLRALDPTPLRERATLLRAQA
jgi:alkylation response protein AidB-like acyl-CoA dehydrogenase